MWDSYRLCHIFEYGGHPNENVSCWRKFMIFFTDLDNTIIYSYKHDIGPYKRNVEWYQGREISFITEETYKLLKEVKEKILIVPVSTRTTEQYKRIDLGVGELAYALVCNGGILLKNGSRVEEWYEDSLYHIKESNDEMSKGLRLLETDRRRRFELRFIDDLFVFTKCDDPGHVVEDLKEKLDESLVDVFNNGVKIYVVPKNLNKGQAVRRFLEYVKEKYAIAAGDSAFDISMLREADKGLAPAGFAQAFQIDFAAEEMPGDKIFSDALLKKCLDIVQAGQ